MMGVVKMMLPQAGVSFVAIRQVNCVKFPFRSEDGWKSGKPESLSEPWQSG